MFKKILITNRGEIAVRIINACKEMSIRSAVIYSEPDVNSLHVRLSDEAYLIGPAAASESYLSIPKIIQLAKDISADAIHPGYGFLSENAEFIEAVEKSGITFIGPSSKSVKMMGDKTSARKLMSKHNVPIVPGTTKAIDSIEDAEKSADKIGYPVLLKASGGGGGKGMRVVQNKKEMKEALPRAKNESLKAFGKDDIYIEKFIEDPKHIEVQIIADKLGNYRHLNERECSIQRRHQKVIEESPSPSINNSTREEITDAAIKAAKACNYYNAGTIEFLMDKNGNFYFLEMNTRLQVEHPVTEFITNVDIVKEQIKIANNEKISFAQKDIKINGHAIECRIYAEDGNNDFSPSTGIIKYHRLPSGPGVRVDCGIDTGSNISLYYDSLLSKVITYANSRSSALSRMERALTEYKIAGVITNIPFCKWILYHPKFLDASFNINFINDEFSQLSQSDRANGDIQKYENVAAIFSSLIKRKDNELKPVKMESIESNKWWFEDE